MTTEDIFWLSLVLALVIGFVFGYLVFSTAPKEECGFFLNNTYFECVRDTMGSPGVGSDDYGDVIEYCTRKHGGN